jgi:hypothetical protein
MTVLEVVDDVMVGTVPGCWIRTPTHLDPDCSCGEVEVLLVSLPDGALWLPMGLVRDGDRDALTDCLLDQEAGSWEFAAARLTAAFGLPWERLTVSRVRGQLVLLMALEDSTSEVLNGLDPERLFELRRVSREPADVVRALRLMRDHGSRTQ